MPEWLRVISIMSWPDVFRVVNAVLGITIAGGLMFDRYAPWRDAQSTQKLLTFAIAGSFLWQAYTSIEVVWLIPDAAPAVGDQGVRVYGFTVFFLMVLAALLERHRRAALWESHAVLAEAVNK